MRRLFSLATLALAACSPQGAAPGAPAESKGAAAATDADQIAGATVAGSKLADADGAIAKSLVDALRALPPWAPFYPGARLGLDSSADGRGAVQVGFSTTDSPDKVAAFYLDAFKRRGPATDLVEPGVRTIEVANADGTQITTVIIQPGENGGASGVLKHEGGGY